MQKHVNLVDLVKSFPTNIYLQNLASIQKRTSPVKFAHLAEKSGEGSISNLSTKVDAASPTTRRPRVPTRVERFDRRGIEPFEPFEPFEFFQNRNFPEFFLENSKISENFNIF